MRTHCACLGPACHVRPNAHDSRTGASGERLRARIQSNMRLIPGDVLLDTSALIDLKNEPSLLLRLRRVMRSQRRLVLPLTVLHEFMSHGSPSVARRNIETISALRRELGAVGGESISDFVTAERNLRTFVAGPTFDLEPLIRSLSFFVDDDEAREGLVVKIDAYLAKSRTFEVDRNAAKDFREQLPEAEVTDLFRLRDDLRDNLLGSGKTRGSYFFERHVPSRVRGVARRHPKRFRSSIVYAAMSYIQALSAGFNGWTKPDELKPLFPGIRKTDWVDAMIAAEAAYARIFVSHDESLRARVDCIATAFGFPLSAASLL